MSAALHHTGSSGYFCAGPPEPSCQIPSILCLPFQDHPRLHHVTTPSEMACNVASASRTRHSMPSMICSDFQRQQMQLKQPRGYPLPQHGCCTPRSFHQHSVPANGCCCRVSQKWLSAVLPRTAGELGNIPWRCRVAQEGVPCVSGLVPIACSGTAMPENEKPGVGTCIDLAVKGRCSDGGRSWPPRVFVPSFSSVPSSGKACSCDPCQAK